MKKIRYHGVEVKKPDNLSLNCIKRYIDSVGHSVDVQIHIDFWSNEIDKIKRTCFPTIDILKRTLKNESDNKDCAVTVDKQPTPKCHKCGNDTYYTSDDGIHRTCLKCDFKWHF